MSSPIFIPVILCLSQDGTHFDLKINAEGLRDVKKSDSVHPYLRTAMTCNTYETVIDYLKGLKRIEDGNYKPYHFDDLHHYHHYIKSAVETESKLKIDQNEAHWCEVADMINFVTLKMGNHQPAKL